MVSSDFTRFVAFHRILSGGLLPELFGEPDENSFGTPDVAEPVDVFVVDDFIDHCCTELAEPGEGGVEVIDPADLSSEDGDRFALRTGFDPRSLRTRYLYFRVRPTRVQAWREENELAARDLMRDGAWLDD